MSDLLDKFRAEYPQYQGVSDADLADGIYRKFYAGKMDRASFDASLGVGEKAPDNTPVSGAGRQSARVAGLASKGFMDRASEAVGAIPDLVAQGTNAIGLTDLPKDYYTDKLKAGYSAVGGVLTPDAVEEWAGSDVPENNMERAAIGVGRGVADAATVMVPGAVVANAAKASSLPTRVGQVMSSQPVLQTAAGAAAGGVEGGTDSSMAGLAAALAIPTVPALTRRALSPFASQLSRNETALAEAAERSGINLTPGQKTGSAPLRTMESVFTQTPFTGKSQAGIYDGQRKAFNRAVLEKAGIYADDASPETLDRAFREIGGEFDALAQGTAIKVDKAFLDDIARVESEYGRRLTTDVAPVFKSYIDDLNVLKGELASNPEIAGREYQKISSDIKRRARSAGNNPDLRDALYELTRTLDDAVERSLGGAAKDAWRDVRNRYRNLLTIDKAVGGGTQADRVSANIPFSGLRQAVKANDKTGYGRGRGDLNELSRVGDFLGSSIPPDSGTARRSLMQNMLTFGGPSAGGGYMLAGGDPVTASIMAALTLGGPKAVQSIYNSPVIQKYAANQFAVGGRPYGPLTRNILAAQSFGTEYQPSNRLARELTR